MKSPVLDFYKKFGPMFLVLGILFGSAVILMWLFTSFINFLPSLFIAFLIYFSTNPLSNFLERKGVKKKLSVHLTMGLFVIIIVGTLTTAGYIFTSEIKGIANSFPKYADIAEKQIERYADELEGKIELIPDEYMEKIKENAMNMAQKGAEWSGTFLLGLFGLLTSIPTVIFNFAMGIILAWLMSLDMKNLSKSFSESTPKSFKIILGFLYKNVLSGLGKYIKAQLKIICITFFIIFIGLLTIGESNSFSIAILAAFFDVLPVLGISTVFIPWIVYLLVVGATTKAIGISVIFVIVLAFRQIFEPKIVGDSLGVSAFVMFVVMLASLKLFGIAGIILSPIFCILWKELKEKGHFKEWIPVPEGELEQEKEVPKDKD